jgi:phage/plasmid-like protein (TIGR03299 family)
MPAYFESGFMVGEPAWHGLGNLIPEDEQLTVPAALEAAGLNWEVGLQPLQVAKGGVHIEEQDGSRYDCAQVKGLPGQDVSHRCTVRLSDNKILGVVGPRYRPYQNVQAFDWFQPFLDKDEAAFHTAGSLYGGAVVWVLAKLNRNPMQIVKGDEVQKFLLLTTSHDGSKAVKCGFSPIRVVCANTLAMAEAKGVSQLIKVKHGRGTADAMEALRETINVINQSFEATADQFRALAARQISSKDLEKYVKIVLDIKDADLKKKGKKKTQAINRIDAVTDLFESGMGSKIKAARGTVWAAYNAVTEYLNYHQGRSSETRLNSLWYGTSAKTNKHALAEALKLVA